MSTPFFNSVVNNFRADQREREERKERIETERIEAKRAAPSRYVLTCDKYERKDGELVKWVMNTHITMFDDLESEIRKMAKENGTRRITIDLLFQL